MSQQVDVLRISAQPEKTEKIIEIFHAALDSADTLPDGLAQLKKLTPIGHCDGYWHAKPGIARSL
jgi:hypothetical protein